MKVPDINYFDAFVLTMIWSTVIVSLYRFIQSPMFTPGLFEGFQIISAILGGILLSWFYLKHLRHADKFSKAFLLGLPTLAWLIAFYETFLDGL